MEHENKSIPNLAQCRGDVGSVMGKDSSCISFPNCIIKEDHMQVL